ncbi:MAG: hypothetical protein ACRC28_17310 [Clostridium sp.]|uniref:hypothetical protein n=1 Tax=Clostridium sp. TaxID=1506 RepID=UPI003F36515B
MKNKKKKSKKSINNKKKRIYRTELQKTNKNSEKLIFDAELGIDMNTLIEKNITIADLETLATDDLNAEEGVKVSNTFIPISDFLSPEACEKLFSEDDNLVKDTGLLEVACTSTSELEEDSSTYIGQAILSQTTLFEDIDNTSLTDDASMLEPIVEEDIVDAIEPLNNTVISFPIDNKTLIEDEIERKKKDLNKYLEEEKKFKEFDKKLVTLTREKLSQKKQSNFSRFLNKIFV